MGCGTTFSKPLLSQLSAQALGLQRDRDTGPSLVRGAIDKERSWFFNLKTLIGMANLYLPAVRLQTQCPLPLSFVSLSGKWGHQVFGSQVCPMPSGAHPYQMQLSPLSCSPLAWPQRSPSHTRHTPCAPEGLRDSWGCFLVAEAGHPKHGGYRLPAWAGTTGLKCLSQSGDFV